MTWQLVPKRLSRLEDRFYVTRLRFSAARDQEQTELSLIALGTELV